MLAFPELFETLLEERGIRPEDKEDFLNPKYDKLHSPLLLPDMDRARDRVIQAIKNNEHIVVFSDYDADGIPGAVVLSDFFSRIKYENVSFYIPHRHDQGFGLNSGAIEECGERGAKLIITIDCGVADISEVELANKKGIDVIITDHHEPKADLPDAYAIVNPKRKDSEYPFKELCGSAVIFKLVQAILAKEPFGTKEGMEKWSLDMVGIATLSDMVPLVGENRILAKFGLEVLRKSPRPGLRALLRRLNLEQKNLTEDDVAFMITPRINAASRMGVPFDAFKLLSTRDQVEAERLALHLEKINNERKGIVASLVKDAKAHLSNREKIGEVIVIGSPEWRPSLLGLVANSLVEEYKRPAFVWGRDGDGVLKGSCRSFNGYDLHALMQLASQSFLEFGGHAGAGGFSVDLENLTMLEEKLSEALGKLEGSVSVEAKSLPISITDIGENLWSIISQFAPFGTGNEKPVLKIPQAQIKSVRQFGKENNHLEIELSNGIKAISFFSSPESYKLQAINSPCTLLAHLEKSYFPKLSRVEATDCRYRIMITICTDGASRGNPGPGGWGAVILDEKNLRELGGREEHTTNNRMELTAAISAIDFVKNSATIYTDSEYVMKGMTEWVHNWQRKGWRTANRKPVLNQDLWQELLRVSEGKNIEWKYVAGHQGVALNERADVIATEFADNLNPTLYDGSKDDYK